MGFLRSGLCLSHRVDHTWRRSLCWLVSISCCCAFLGWYRHTSTYPCMRNELQRWHNHLICKSKAFLRKEGNPCDCYWWDQRKWQNHAYSWTSLACPLGYRGCADLIPCIHLCWSIPLAYWHWCQCHRYFGILPRTSTVRLNQFHKQDRELLIEMDPAYFSRQFWWPT